MTLHPLFASAYPIALTAGDAFYVYDAAAPDAVAPGAAASGYGRYRFEKSVRAAGPIPHGLCAALPLPGYHNKPVIIADPVLFDAPEGQVHVLGGCVSCHLQQSAQQVVCQRLGASDVDDILAAEIPLAASDMLWLYTTLVGALEGQASRARIAALRRELRELVAPTVWRKLLYLEWHNGLMRYLEAKIRQRLNLPADLQGAPPEAGEGSLGYGGAQLIAWLEALGSQLVFQPLSLFERMSSLGSVSDGPDATS